MEMSLVKTGIVRISPTIMRVKTMWGHEKCGFHGISRRKGPSVGKI